MMFRIFAVVLSLACVGMAPPPPDAYAAQVEPFDARAEIADALYAAPETRAAADRAGDESIKRERVRIDALAARVREGDGLRAELTAAEEDFITALSALDQVYAARIATIRASLTGTASGASAASSQIESQSEVPPGAMAGSNSSSGSVFDQSFPANPESAYDAQGLAARDRQAQDDERRAQAEAEQARAQMDARRRAQLEAAQAARADAGARRGPIEPPKLRPPSPVPPKPGYDGSGRPIILGAVGILGSASGRPRSAPPKRAANALPNFPWPPPTPSERLNLTRAQILPAAFAHPSLADVGAHIVAALEAAGYSEYSFYAVPRGFAVVARLERIQPDGTPAPEQLRFLAPDSVEPFSLTAYVSRLFFAPEGYYRQIVFAVTTDMIRPSGAAPTAKAAEALLQGGADRLPAEFRNMPFTSDYQVAALIYEYHKGPDARDVKTLTPGRLDARTNLVRAGIYPRLVAVR